MIDPKKLLDDLQREVRALEDDLRQRADELDEVGARLRAEHTIATRQGRTAHSYETWLDQTVTQVAVSWVLATTFVRFCEDNGLVPEARITGPGERAAFATDAQVAYFREHPSDTDREYLLDAIERLARYSALAGLFDAHNPLYAIPPSADAANQLLTFWRKIDADTGGALVHDFTDPTADTRFLGDLYQDLSESARKTFALLQTPRFVEEFILDRSLEPALAEYGLADVALIDPACGSGHFLLGAFDRLMDRWQRAEPGTNPVELAQRALRQVTGVDLNPFAVAIAKFRLLVAALNACSIKRLADAPGWEMRLAAGDSLLFGSRPGEITRAAYFTDELHATPFEDAARLDELLTASQYQVVVGNPPYITVSDTAINQAYRSRFTTCHRQYQLVCPFIERFFDLAAPNGYVGTIVSNAFMKREFGKKLIQEYLPTIDLTHILDTSRAHIPGHGTATVVLLARNRAPRSGVVRVASSIRGQSPAPAIPERGLVWNEIVHHVDESTFDGEFVSFSDTARERFASHPWSIGGGGAAELRSQLEARASSLSRHVDSVGRTTVVGDDDAWILGPVEVANRLSVERVAPLVRGESVRDWQLATVFVAYPYDGLVGPVVDSDDTLVTRFLWPNRTLLRNRTIFGKQMGSNGDDPWYAHLEHYESKLRIPLSITFAFVATHNHFVLDRGGKAFNRSAPVIKLPERATEDDHLSLLGVLNSSVACFWMKQVFFDKGIGGIGGGIGDEAWEPRFEFDGTKLQRLPLPADPPLERARRLDSLGQEHARLQPTSVCVTPPTRAALNDARASSESVRSEHIALQEELDWDLYDSYGLLDESLTAPSDVVPALRLGERAFEIALARRVAAGKVETAWFTRHRSTPITEVPADWPAEYRAVVERRLELIADNRAIALIERPEYKRRWAQDPWEEREQAALREWLLGRLESSVFWPDVALQSCARLSDRALADPEFVQVAELFVGSDEVDMLALVRELAMSDAVPYLAAYRYKDAGFRTRTQWETTWELQRAEDAIDARSDLADDEKAATKARDVGTIAVPPKYKKHDFASTAFWRLRGKLDVPKERFISYPGAEREADGSPVLGWAGWDHLQRAQALAAYAVEREQQEGWASDRLVPLLAGLWELVPWLRQWHNELDPALGQGLGTWFDNYVRAEAQRLGTTANELPAWRPPETGRRRRRS